MIKKKCLLSIVLFSFIYISLGEIDKSILAQKKARSGPLYFLGWAVLCKFQAVGWDCSINETSESRFYYDIKLQDCSTYEYSDCEPSYNNFLSLGTCEETCLEPGQRGIRRNYTSKVYCRMQPDFGDCNSYEPMYYFDMTERKCKGFAYSGCGGNLNKFSTQRLCMSVCEPAVPWPKNEIEIQQGNATF